MSKELLYQSEEDVIKSLLKPLDELLSKEDEELKEVDELIREAERKSKAGLHPEP